LQSISWPSQGEARQKLHGGNCAELFGVLGAQRFARDPFQFQKRRQLFVGVDNEALTVVAMCVSYEDEDRSCAEAD
jgi:hypothetical protein